MVVSYHRAIATLMMEIHGESLGRFAVLRPALHKVLAGRNGGGSVAVVHDGTLVAHFWGGEAAPGTAWKQDTLAVSFSTTKGVASTVLHRLADAGLIEYEAPVQQYWPEFGVAGKEGILVKHLLTHRAALHNIRDLVSAPEDMLDWDGMVARLAAARPPVGPTNTSTYHGITYGWLVGEVARRVSGKSVSQLVQEMDADLGTNGLRIGVPEQDLARVAPLQILRKVGRSTGHAVQSRKPSSARKQRQKMVRRAIERTLESPWVPVNPQYAKEALLVRGMKATRFSDPEFVSAMIPAANGAFTADSLAYMYASLAGFGPQALPALVSPATLSQIRKVQVHAADRALMFRMGWRLGYHGAYTTRGTIRGAFGHYGYGGSGAWVDPRRRLAFAFTTNAIEPSLMGLRIARLGRAVFDALR